MRPIDRACRTCLAMLLVAGLSGCANLEAVRDFTASSARLTDYKAVTERYFASVDHVLAEMPDTPDFTKDRNDTEALRRAQAAQKETLLKLHDTVTGYLAALARLAGDDTFDLSGSIDAVSGKLVLVPNLGIDSTHVDAYASIAKTVTSWTLAAVQARDVANLARQHGPAMDTLLGGLQTVTSVYETGLRNERGQILAFEEAREVSWKLPLDAETGPANKDAAEIAFRREAVVAWGRRGYALLAQEESAAVDDAHRAANGIAEIRRGHAEMLKNLDHLDRKELVAELKKAAADLKAIRASLKRL